MKKVISIILIIFLFIPVNIFTTGAANINFPAFPSVGVCESHMVALKSDHTLWVWENIEQYGQIGGGITEWNIIPAKIMNDVVQFSTGNGYIMAIKSDDTLWAWGNSYWWGYLIDDNMQTYFTDEPVKIMDGVV